MNQGKLIAQSTIELPNGHAELKIFESDDKSLGSIRLSRKEQQDLTSYIERQGYLSHKLDPGIFDLLKRMRENGIE